MPLVGLAQESLKQGAFYAPRFELRIQGADLPRDVLRDVIQISYKDNVKELDSFEMTVNNWDPETRSFKYVGAETRESLDGDTPESRRFRLFEPCHKQVSLALGYLEELTVMLTGNFTTMEPTFSASGPPTLNVRGLNVLHSLRRKQYTYSWTDRRDSEVAKEISEMRDGSEKRFPLPVEVDDRALGNEPVLPYLAQQNQYDIDFLLGRARERGYVLVVREADGDTPGSQRRLYFGPPHGGEQAARRDVTFELVWGKSLIDFKPTLTTANQIRSVTVNGWNRRTKKPIQAKVTLDDPELRRRNEDLHEILSKCDPREEIVVDRPVFTPDDAKKLAQGILLGREQDFVKASGTTVGLPDLAAGRKIEIGGVGCRFNGTYFVSETTHTLNQNGYTTSFKANRENPEAGSGPARTDS